MRSLFPGHYRPTQEDFNKMWRDCIFVLDANVLLHIYRYTPETRNRFFQILERLQERIWVPHQAAYEFSNRRFNVIMHTEQEYESIKKWLTDNLGAIQQELSNKKRHPFFPHAEEYVRHVTKGVNKAVASLEKAKASHPSFDDDPLFEKLSQLLEGRIGPAFPSERLEEVYKEGARRYENKVPPGYMDAKSKEGSQAYGDFVLWQQVIEYAKSTSNPIILITDDNKEDWWWEYNGKKIGPRTELVEEILREASAPFYMYQSERFIELAQEFLKLRDQQAAKAVEEARKVRELEAEEQQALRSLNEHMAQSEALREDFAHRANLAALEANRAFEELFSVQRARSAEMMKTLKLAEEDRQREFLGSLEAAFMAAQRNSPFMVHLQPDGEIIFPPKVIPEFDQPQDSDDQSPV